MKKLFFTLCLFAATIPMFAQTENARVRSDDTSQPEIDNLSGAKPDEDDISPSYGVTSYTVGGMEPLVVDKPDDSDDFNPTKPGIDALRPVDLTTATIYPNPATDFITVTTEATTGYIRVLNLLGQEMQLQQIVSQDNYLNVSSLNEGIYFVSIETGNQKVVKKIKILN